MTDSTTSSPSLVSLKGDQQALNIQWSDGISHRLTWHVLRSHCPCATCRMKPADPPANPFAILKPEEAAPVRVTAMRPLGNYAYHIDFSDGHNTGIYSLDLLRELGEHYSERPA